jgi:hypothetical protein
MIWNPSVAAKEHREIDILFVLKLEFCDLPGMDSMFQISSLDPVVNRVVH